MELISAESMVVYEILIIHWSCFQVYFYLRVRGEALCGVVGNRRLACEDGATLARGGILTGKVLECIIRKAILSLVKTVPHCLNLVREVVDLNCFVLNLGDIFKS